MMEILPGHRNHTKTLKSSIETGSHTGGVTLVVPGGKGEQSEVVATFALPQQAAQLSVAIGENGGSSGGIPVSRCAFATCQPAFV